MINKAFIITSFSILILLLGCRNVNEIYYDEIVFRDIKSIDNYIENDTLNIIVSDISYIFFSDYDSLKISYLLWKNKDILSINKTIKATINHHDSANINTFVIGYNEQQSILKAYQNNYKFDSITSILISEFNPTDVMNLRNVNHFLNGEQKGYNNDYIGLLHDLSNCNNDSLANNRVERIIRLIKVTGIPDYWTHEKINADELVNKLEKLLKVSNLEI